jgi:hypothetical protein
VAREVLRYLPTVGFHDGLVLTVEAMKERSGVAQLGART